MTVNIIISFWKKEFWAKHNLTSYMCLICRGVFQQRTSLSRISEWWILKRFVGTVAGCCSFPTLPPLCFTDLCSNRRFSATTDSAAVVANLQSQFLAQPLGRHHKSDHPSNCHFPWVLSPLGEGQSRLMNALQGYKGLIFCHTLLSKSDQCDHWPWTPSNWGERHDGGKGLDLGQFVWSSTLLQYPHVHWADSTSCKSKKLFAYHLKLYMLCWMQWSTVELSLTRSHVALDSWWKTNNLFTQGGNLKELVKMWGSLSWGIFLHIVGLSSGIKCYDCNKKDRFREMVRTLLICLLSQQCWLYIVQRTNWLIFYTFWKCKRSSHAMWNKTKSWEKYPLGCNSIFSLIRFKIRPLGTWCKYCGWVKQPKPSWVYLLYLTLSR